MLNAFISEGYWDEARIITNTELIIPEGLSAPELKNGILGRQEQLLNDTIHYYINKNS